MHRKFATALGVDDRFKQRQARAAQVLVDAVDLAGHTAFADAVVVGVVCQSLYQACLCRPPEDDLFVGVGICSCFGESCDGSIVFFKIFAGSLTVSQC